MNVKELSDLELGKLLAQQINLIHQMQKNVERLNEEIKEREESVRESAES